MLTTFVNMKPIAVFNFVLAKIYFTRLDKVFRPVAKINYICDLLNGNTYLNCHICNTMY